MAKFRSYVKQPNEVREEHLWRNIILGKISCRCKVTWFFNKKWHLVSFFKYSQSMGWFARNGNIAMKSDNKIEPHLKHFVDYNFELTLNRWWFDLSHNRLLQPDIPHFAKSNFSFVSTWSRFRLSSWIFRRILNCQRYSKRTVILAQLKGLFYDYYWHFICAPISFGGTILTNRPCFI